MSITPRLECDVESRAGAVRGEGPLVNIPWLRFTRSLNSSGSFETEIPLRDPRSDLIEEKQTVLRFYWNGEEIFVGVVESTGVTVDNAGVLMLPVSGRCLGGAELSEAKIGFLTLRKIVGFLPSGVDDGPALVLAAATTTPDTWVLDSVDGFATTSTLVYAKFAGESALQALRKIGERVGEHWRFHNTDRKVVWMRDSTPNSGIRAIQGAPDMISARSNPEICFFDSFSESKDVHGLFNRIYPYGAGSFEIATTLNATTRIAPAGFTLSTANNYLQSDTSIADLGLTIPIYAQFPDIRPVSNTDLDIEIASNALYDAALAMLQRHDSVSDFQVYELGGIYQLPDSVKVGSTIDVIYEDDRYNVEQDFIVLSIDTEITSSAAVVHNLTVGAVDKTPKTGTDSIVNSMEDGRVFQSHPILNVNSYETGYTKFAFHDGVDEEPATIYFDFDAEVTQIQQVLLKFETAGGSPVQMLPLESTVRSTGGTSTSTSSGGGATVTSASGGGSTVTSASGGGATVTSASDGGNHVHTVPLVNSTSSTMQVYYNHTGKYFEVNQSGAFTSSDSTNINHTHDVIISNHAHDVTISNHAHDVTIANHTHDVTASIVTNYGVHRESSTNTFRLEDLRYRVNGGAYANLIDDAVVLSGNRYSLDLTSQLYDPNFRPNQTHNTLEITKVATATADRKSCTIDAVLKVRNLIQSTAII